MEEVVLLFRMCIAGLFMTTSVSKMKNLLEHVAVVKEYQILPEKLAFLFSKLDVYVEFLLGCLLFIGLFQRYAAIASAVLLLMYLVAIAINLLRGRTDISCGCGGAAGNHHLSWILVIRNLVLTLICCVIYAFPPTLGSLQAVFSGASFTNVFSSVTGVILLLAWSILLVGFIGNKYLDIKQQIHHLLQAQER